VWGIVAVAVLMAYGSSFRGTLVHAFEAFGKSAVVAWPGQTSEQAGGGRAGKRVPLEEEGPEAGRQGSPLVKHSSLETVRRFSISYGDRMANAAVRGVYPEYGQIRNEVAGDGRWLSPEDFLERRRMIFLGGRLREKLFGGRPAVGENVQV